jgi:hypothetical protein
MVRRMIVRCVSDEYILPDMHDENYRGPTHTRYPPGTGITIGQTYEVVAVKEDGTWYQIIDDTGEAYAYPASRFEIVSG